LVSNFAAEQCADGVHCCNGGGKICGQPSFNHAWYIWGQHSGKPTLAYAP